MSRLVRVGLAWVVLAAVVRVALLQPEHCAVPSGRSVRVSAASAIGWFDRNQQPSGRFVYAYRRDTDQVLDNAELVRHHGVLLSLYQAAHDGYPDALAIADRALLWSQDRLLDTGAGGRAIGRPGEPAATGASALLVAALVERRAATGDQRHDALIRSVARFLLGQVDERGSVRAAWDEDDGPLPEYSLFFTGETMWALARVATVEPDGPWADAASRISKYIAVDRNRTEERLPFFSDHWAGYGFAELAESGLELSDAEVGYARHIAGLFDTSIRFESQNTGAGLVAATRGAPSLGAGVGTLGEGAGGLQRVAEQDERLADLRAPLRRTVACVASVLVDRQVQADEVGEGEDPDLTVGAWFRNDRTQLDDQQHALSALLTAARIGAVGPSATTDRPTHTDHGGASGLFTLLLTLFAAANPPRLRALPDRAGRARRVVGLGVVGLAVILASSWLLDVLDVSDPTARVAAGVVVALSAAVDLVDPKRLGTAVLRPGPLLILLVGAVDPGAGRSVAGLAAVVVLAMVSATVGRSGESTRWTQAARWIAALALVLGLDLVVDGIYEF